MQKPMKDILGKLNINKYKYIFNTILLLVFILCNIPTFAQNRQIKQTLAHWDSLLNVPPKAEECKYAEDTLQVLKKLVITAMKDNGADTNKNIILPIAANCYFLTETDVFPPSMLNYKLPYNPLYYPCLYLETEFKTKLNYLSANLDSIVTKYYKDSLQYKKYIEANFSVGKFCFGEYPENFDNSKYNLQEKYPYKYYIYFSCYSQPSVTDIHIYPNTSIALVILNDCINETNIYEYNNKTQTWHILSTSRWIRLKKLNELTWPGKSKSKKARGEKKIKKEFLPIKF